MDVEYEISKIKRRNKRVEADKRWETSVTRKACIAFLTYLVVLSYQLATKSKSSIFVSSFVPVLGFLLSGASLSIVRVFWERYRRRKG